MPRWKGLPKVAQSLCSPPHNPGFAPIKSQSFLKSSKEIHIISYCRVPRKANADIRALAQSKLADALKDATYRKTDEWLLYASPFGHGLLRELEDTNLKLRKVQVSLKDRQRRRFHLGPHSDILREASKDFFGICGRFLDTLQPDILNNRPAKRTLIVTYADILYEASNGFFNIRERFLDTFRLNILKDKSAYRTIMMEVGNSAAHGGNAVVDAYLYESGSREEDDLMVKIYGLNATEILSLSSSGDNRSIEVLNARATLKANKYEKIRKEVEVAWEKYVAELKRNWGQFPTKDPKSNLGRAYTKFWSEYNERKWFCPECGDVE